MSDNNIPFEIQSEIMKRLPVKSLLRFRYVSKSYKSLIHSSQFIIHYISQHQHLLVSCCDFDHIWIVDDDDSFPKQRVSVTLPDLVKKLENPYTIGSSHGLLCFADMSAMNMAVWNPFIRKAVVVNVSHMPDDDYDEMYITFLGFGVCRETTDPKIVKIAIDTDGVNPWQVEVFALSTRAWRSPYSTNVPSKSIYVYWDPVVVDGCLYWLASARFNYLIVSFDLTTEEFGEVSLAGSLVQSQFSLSLYNLRESLVVIEPGIEADKLAYHVWMMEDGVPKSFNKLFTISNHSPDVTMLGVRGFRKKGEALVEVRLHPGSTRILAAYEPFSKSISNVGTNGTHSLYFVNSYMETLLML